MKVIIAGSRGFDNFELMVEKCDRILEQVPTPVTVISGTASGADQLGEKYAKLRWMDIERFPADWDKHGKSAGIIRNKEMAEAADGLIAFWDGKSRGTKHMIETAINKNLKVRVVRY